MRTNRFAMIALMLVLFITGCGDSGVRSPGLKRDEGNNHNAGGGNHIAQRSSSPDNSKSEPLTRSFFI